jgi:hypothetical protein
MRVYVYVMSKCTHSKLSSRLGRNHRLPCSDQLIATQVNCVDRRLIAGGGDIWGVAGGLLPALGDSACNSDLTT